MKISKQIKFFFALGWLGILAAWPMASTAANESAAEIKMLRQMSKAFAAVAKQAMPAVVFIQVEKTIRQPAMPNFIDPEDLLEQLFGIRPRQRSAPERRFRQPATGTGFIISEDGYILTNNHIVSDADRITVRTHDGQTFQAELVGTDPRSEVALIKIKAKGLPVMPIGDSDTLEIGEWVIAIGNPFGLSETLTLGVVSAKGRNNIGITDYEDFIQTDAAINPGNSGGPLLNIEGKAVGINTAIFSQMGGSLGIGFAIPINMAMQIKDHLLGSGTVRRGFLGVIIQDLTPDLAQSFNYPQKGGALIAEVVKDSPADKAGMRVGDVVMAINDKPIENAGMLRNQVALTPPGTTLNVAVWRNGKRHELKVKISGQSETSEETPAPFSISALSEKIGLYVENLTPQWSQRFGYAPDSGVLVTRVRPESPAAAAGIQPGNLIVSVNHRDTANVDQFNKALAEAGQSGMLLLLVKDQQSARFIAIPFDR